MSAQVAAGPSPATVAGPQAWRGADLQGHRDWTGRLDARECDELMRAVDRVAGDSRFRIMRRSDDIRENGIQQTTARRGRIGLTVLEYLPVGRVLAALEPYPHLTAAALAATSQLA